MYRHGDANVEKHIRKQTHTQFSERKICTKRSCELREKQTHCRCENNNNNGTPIAVILFANIVKCSLADNVLSTMHKN